MIKQIVFTGLSMLFAGIMPIAVCPAFTQQQSTKPAIFELTDIKGEVVSFSVPSEGLVVLEWFNQSCPFVQKFYKYGFMQSLQESYRDQGVRWFVINSTNPSHRDFLSTDARKRLVSEWNMDPQHLFFDETGAFGSYTGAKTTPHIFIFKDGDPVYNGAVDDAPDTESRPEDAKNHIKDILDRGLKNAEVTLVRNRPYGCSIKYAR